MVAFGSALTVAGRGAAGDRRRQIGQVDTRLLRRFRPHTARVAEALAGGGAAGMLGGGAPEMVQPEVTMPANAIRAIAASGRGAPRRPYLQPGPGGLQGPAGCG